MLEDLDRTKMPYTVPRQQIKKFIKRLLEDVALEDRGLLKIQEEELQNAKYKYIKEEDSYNSQEARLTPKELATQQNI